MNSQLKTELTARGARIDLPRRKANGGCAGVFLIVWGLGFGGIPLIMAVGMLFGLQVQGWAGLLALIFFIPFIVIGLGAVGVGLWMFIGDCRITVTDDQLILSRGLGPFRVPKKHPLGDVRALKIAPATSVKDALAGIVSLQSVPKTGTPRTIIGGYESSVIDELAERISEQTGIPFAGTSDSPSVAAGELDESATPRAPVARPAKPSFVPGQPIARVPDFELPTPPSYVPAGLIMLLAGAWNVCVLIAFVIMFFLVKVESWIAMGVWGVVALIGLGLLAWAVHRWLAESKLGQPVLRVSAHPVFLGETFTVQFHQPVKGRGRLNGVTLTLVCEERATYRQGTSTSTATHKVINEKIDVIGPGTLVPGRELDGSASIHIPTDAMHTFVAKRNEIHWRIETRTDIAAWPDYFWGFSLEVAPRAAVSEEVEPA